MKKLATLAAVGLLAAALTAPTSPAAADGPECNNANHCYGIVNYGTGNMDSVAVDLWTDCLHLDTPASDFATHELYMWTNASLPAITWVEGGYVRGYIAGGDPETFFRWFWGEWTGSAYYSHFASWASVAQWKEMWFDHYSNDTWAVYLGGTYVGTTAQHATAGYHVQVGAETTEPQVYSHGKARYLQWHPWGAPGWTWATTGSVSSSPGVYSVSASGTTMEQTGLKKSCSSPLASARVKLAPPSMKDVTAAAKSIAETYGEKTPSRLELVPTTRKAAQKTVGAGDKLADNPAVYLVQMSGDFVGKAPKGAPLPRGNTMTVTVDAKTGEVTDLSLGNSRADLKKLGAAKAL